MHYILAHEHKVDSHRRRVSNYAKHFQEFNQGDIHVPLKKKGIPTFEQLNSLKILVFEFSLSFTGLSANYIIRNCYEE